MDLHQLFVSQRALRAPAQVSAMVAALRDGGCLPLILLSEDDDGTVQIEDGHHRACAYARAGRASLARAEYRLVPRERRRPRFGRLPDLMRRVTWTE